MAERIYLDNAATTALRPEVADAMRAALEESGYNPSSLHAEGRRARAVLDGARDRVAALLGASRREITFTASGTEADNTAIAGSVRALRRKGHVVASAIEHHAVLHSVFALREQGFDVSLVPVTSDGIVEPEAFERALRPDTLLATVMTANNEIGTIQPVDRLASIARERGVLFHTDAVQAVGWMPLRPRTMGVDVMALSAHKFHGPKGVGVLFSREGLAIDPIVVGGGQEFGRRSGTENVLGIAATARALELAATERPERTPAVRAMRDRLEAAIVENVADVRINGASAPRLPYISNVSFGGVTSEALLVRLDLEGVAASAGSACTSGVLEPSHVIAALGLDAHWQSGAIRFSLGDDTRPEEIERLIDVLPRLVEEIRGKR